ncbi:MAG: hypothetical protein HYY09_01115 [Firmicutes bacterium]|nr:hypothetical protein [Bacillota bacterium]
MKIDDLPPENVLLMERARKGDRDAWADFITRYLPFIYSTASRVIGRRVNSCSDEASISMTAFIEAATRFEADRGSRFLAFARRTIRWRLADYYRRERVYQRACPYGLPAEGESPGEDERETRPAAWRALAQGAWDRWRRESEGLDFREEIQGYRKELAASGLSLAVLSQVSPLRRSTRHRAFQAALTLAGDPALLARARKGRLPINELIERTGVGRKVLERHRRYILAITILLAGNYPSLRSYVEEALRPETVSGAPAGNLLPFP